MLRRKRPVGGTVKAADRASAFAGYLAGFLDHSGVTGATVRTVQTRRDVIGWFIAWCAERGLDRPQDITRPILERYQRHLFHYRKANGEPLSYGTQVHRIVPLKGFFRWLARENHILYNPAADLILPRLPRRLPRHVLTPAQVTAILNQPDTTTPQGVRDRAMLETLYSSGMRRMELTNLKLVDVDTERGAVMIREGKGRKDRFIPLGSRACAWIVRYRDEVRPELLAAVDDGTLFLTDYGEPFIKARLGDLVRRHVRQADLGVSGSCHLFRHACATHMLENGADIRYIQALLGHADISTTQVYTEVSLARLKAVHELTHPARIERCQDAPTAADDATLMGEETAARCAFLAALQDEAEADEEDAPDADAVAADAPRTGRR